MPLYATTNEFSKTGKCGRDTGHDSYVYEMAQSYQTLYYKIRNGGILLKD